MVNLRKIASDVSKSEAKDLLDKAQTIIDTKIKGPNTKSRRDKLLSKDKTPVKVDGEETAVIDDVAPVLGTFLSRCCTLKS